MGEAGATGPVAGAVEQGPRQAPGAGMLGQDLKGQIKSRGLCEEGWSCGGTECAGAPQHKSHGNGIQKAGSTVGMGTGEGSVRQLGAGQWLTSGHDSLD